MTEQQPYTVIDSPAGFELRRYPEHLVAEVTVSSSFEDAGNRAFRYLFNYISGGQLSPAEGGDDGTCRPIGPGCQDRHHLARSSARLRRVSLRP